MLGFLLAAYVAGAEITKPTPEIKFEPRAMEIGVQDERTITSGDATSLERSLNRGKELKAGWVRMMVRPSNVDYLAPRIKAARDKGFRVQGTLEWTGSDESFLRLAAHAARKYRGSVTRWGVVNEPTWTMRGAGPRVCGTHSQTSYATKRIKIRWVWKRVRGGYIKKKLRKARVKTVKATTVVRRYRAKRRVFVKTRKRYKGQRLYVKRHKRVRVTVTRPKMVTHSTSGCKKLDSFDHYRALYRRAYPLIKRESGGAEVLIGEINSGGGSKAWVEHMLCMRPAVGDCSTLRADGYAHHPYQFDAPPEKATGNWGIGDTSRIQSTLREAARRGILRTPNNGVVPLLFNEFGYVGKSDHFRNVPDSLQAEWLPRAYAHAKRNGVKTVSQYHLDPSNYHRWDSSILRADGSPRPQFNTLKNWIGGNK